MNDVAWKDMAPVIIAGLMTLLGVIYSQWDKKRLAREERRAHEAETRETLGRNLEAAQGHDLTARFTALMDGYENRIHDVTTDLASTRSEMSALRAAYSAHQDRCRNCPYFVGLERSNAG
jgi:hypothetical protein